MERRLLLSASAVEGSAAAMTTVANVPAGQQAVWINPAGGDWGVASNWQSGVVPGLNDDVTINEPNNPIITYSGGSATVANITSSDPIALTGGSLTVNGTMDVAAGVALEGGTLVGAKVAADTQLTTPVPHVVSTLDGLEVDGDLTIAGSNGTEAFVCVVDGLLLDGAIHIGNGNSAWAAIEFGNSTSVPGSLLGNGQVILNAGSFGNDSSGAGIGALTIGPGILIGGTGAIDNSASGGGGIVNQGRIDADVASGGLTIGNGQESSLPLGFVNDGMLEATAGGLTIAGTYTTADLGTFSATGGAIYLQGTLDNSGATLQLGSTSGTVHDSATIEGGTIMGAAGATLVGGTLDGVALQGSLTLLGTAQVYDGLTINGTVYLGQANGSASGTLRFGDAYGRSSGSLMGSGNLVFGPDTANYISNEAQIVGNSSTNTTLTIGPGITIRGADGNINNAPSDTIVNQGVIGADTSGGVITVGNYNGGVTSSGTFGAANGGELVVNGSFTPSTFGAIAQSSGGVVELNGSLDNTGAALNLTAATGSLTLNGTLTGGTVNESGGAQLITQTATLDGVLINGDLDASIYNSVVTILDGLTLNGTMYVGNAAGSTSGKLYFGQTGTSAFGLSGIATIVFGASSSNIIENNSNLSGAAGTWTIGPNVLIRGESGGVVSTWAATASIVMQGSVNADTPGGTLTIDNGNGTLTNSGTMQATNGGSLSVANVDVNGLSITGGGTLTFNGQWTNSGSVTVTGSTLDLGGYFSMASMGTINKTNTIVNLTGSFENVNSTLALNASTGSWNLTSGGSISGGTITESDGAQLNVVNGWLIGVTLASDLTISENDVLDVFQGLTLAGGATITLGNAADNTPGQLIFPRVNQSLGGNGSILFAGTGANLIQNNVTSSTLTIGPGITIHGQNGTISNSYSTGTLINQGTINSDTAGGTITLLKPGTLINDGTLEATSGSLNITLPLTEASGSTLYESASSSIALAGSLTASNTGPSSFQPLGSMTLMGKGTAASPQLLEVMSSDLGNLPAGFTNNFAYGSLSVASGDYVKLTDLANNSGGAGPEAIYVNSLSIPTGATLDLNGLHVYANKTQLGGKIAGETTSLAGTGPNPSNAAQPLIFTASLSGGVPDGEMLTLEDASNHNAVVASGKLSNGSATLAVSAGVLLAGTHNLIAVYAGNAHFASSQSAPFTQTVQVAVTKVQVNGNVSALVGAQRSMVNSILYTFSEPVNIGIDAATIAIRSGQSGTLPTSLIWTAINPSADGSSTEWAVTFSGNGITGGSIGNGVYDISINDAAVTSDANPAAIVQTRPADTFFRLFGDINGDGRVNNADYAAFLSTNGLKAGQAGFNAAFDSNGDGRINNLDYGAFLNDNGLKYSGFAATI
jgi:hypothetical protein